MPENPMTDVIIEKEIKKEPIEKLKCLLDLKQISSMVVTELTVLYKTGAFLNKDLFKKLAKKLSHFILYRNFSNESLALDEIRRSVAKLKNCTIHAEADFDHIFD